MAHLVTITRECARCPRTAVVRLHNSRNEPMADYCQHHGNHALGELREQERKDALNGGGVHGASWTPEIDRDGR